MQTLRIRVRREQKSINNLTLFLHGQTMIVRSDENKSHSLRPIHMMMSMHSKQTTKKINRKNYNTLLCTYYNTYSL